MKKFLTIRDSYGSTQIMLPDKSPKIKPESVVKITGSVNERPEGLKNPNMKTGGIEILADEIQTLNKCSTIPFSIHDNRNVNEDTRLKHRYLDLRSSEMQTRLRMRSNLLFKMREFLCEKHSMIYLNYPYRK